MSHYTLAICLISLLACRTAADSGMCTSKPDGLGGSPGEGSCSAPPDFQEEEHEDGAYQHPKLIDISMPLTPELPVFQSTKGLGNFKRLAADMDKGAAYYSTEVTLGVHTGTHVDAPSHYLKDEFKAGNTVDKLDLEVLIGPALVLDIPHDSNITADVLADLNIPHDAERILFKTANSKRDLLRQTAFASDYVGLSADGARFLVEHTHVKLTGIDYLSIARQEDLTEAHQILLKKGIIPVEGLDLTALEGGRWYHLTCLPLNIPGAEGSPTRCVVYGPDTQHEEDRRAALEYPLEDEHEAEHGHEHDSVDATDEL